MKLTDRHMKPNFKIEFLVVLSESYTYFPVSFTNYDSKHNELFHWEDL